MGKFLLNRYNVYIIQRYFCVCRVSMSAEIGTLVDYGKKYVVSYRKPFQSAVDSLTQWNKKTQIQWMLRKR